MRYLYIHANDFDGVHIIFKVKKYSSNVRVGRIRKVPEDFNHLKNLILDSLGKKIMIVLDGALSSLIKGVLYPIRESTRGTVLITCTSFDIIAKMNSGTYFSSSTPMHSHTMESWTKEEYKVAITSGALQEMVEEELEERYYYAG